MRMNNSGRRLLSAAVLMGTLLTMTNPSEAQAPSQITVDEQKRSADYWEALKKETDARKAIAEARAAISNSEAAARAALIKSETEADKAKLDYLKAQLPTIPDPSKYKIAAQAAPVLAASASRMTFDETEKLSATIAKTLQEKLKPAGAGVVVLPDDARTRTLIALSRALRETLDQANARLNGEAAGLEDKINKGVGLETSPVLLPALSALGELVLSYATILRTQYGFTTIPQTALAETVLRAKVHQALVDGGTRIVEPDSVVVIVSGSIPPELQKLRALQDTIAEVRRKIRAASARSEEFRNAAAAAPEDKKKPLLKLAEEIDAKAKQSDAAADEINKMLATLYIADTQGNTPLDAALRGGKLNDLLSAPGGAGYLLLLKAAASDVDTVAANRFFSGLHVAVRSNTVVSWRLTSLDGFVVSTGATRQDSPLEKVVLP